MSRMNMAACWVIICLTTGAAMGADHDPYRLLPGQEAVSASLERMSPAERAAACIAVEAGRTDDSAPALGREVEVLWNAGQCDAALAVLRELELRAGPRRVAVGISWREPVPTCRADLWGTDVRICPFDSLLDVSLSVHRPTGNLFAVMRSGIPLGQKLRCYMSTNGGLTWFAVWALQTPDTLPSADAAVLGDFLYIAYLSSYSLDEVLIRRQSCIDGGSVRLPNGQYSAVACDLAGTGSVKELALVGNQNGPNDRLYLATLATTDRLYWSRSDTGAVAWPQVTTGVTDARCGLGLTENEGSDARPTLCSFYSTSDSLMVFGGADSSFSRRWAVAAVGDRSSIAAYRDTAVCAFDYGASSPPRVRCIENHGTETWDCVDLSDTTAAATSPAVTGPGGGGFAAAFRQQATAAQLHLRRRGYSGGAWSVPVSMADGDVHLSRPAAEYLGDGVFGVAFLSGTAPVVRGAYFDRSDWGTGISEPTRPMAYGSRLTATHVRGVLFLAEATSHRLQTASLLDAAGRSVLSLKPGANDVHCLAPGVYFVHSTVDNRQSEITKVVITR